MLQLTCNNDHDTLKAVLDYGEKEFGPVWETEPPEEEADQTKRSEVKEEAKKQNKEQGIEEETKLSKEEADQTTQSEVKEKASEAKDKAREEKENHEKKLKEGRKQNPIMISSQNNYDMCTQALYSAGYRIPQNKLKRKGKMEGYEERSRQQIVMELPNQDDAVEKLLLYKAYSNPRYLSMALENDQTIEDLSKGLTDDKRTEEPKKETILRDLQRIDPLRRAFDLAEEAEQRSNNVQGFSELKNSYKEIQEELEGFTQSILTQCSNMARVRSILELNPDDDDKVWQERRSRRICCSDSSVEPSTPRL